MSAKFRPFMADLIFKENAGFSPFKSVMKKDVVLSQCNNTKKFKSFEGTPTLFYRDYNSDAPDYQKDNSAFVYVCVCACVYGGQAKKKNRLQFFRTFLCYRYHSIM